MALSVTDTAKKLERHEVLEIVAQYGRPDNFRSALGVAGTWLAIAAVIALGAIVDRWWMVPILMLFLAGLQNRLFTIYHDAFHRVLFSNAKLGHWVGRRLAAHPAISRYDAVRKRHIAHHANTATPNDPERISHVRSWRALLTLMFPIPYAICRRLLGWAPFLQDHEAALEGVGQMPPEYAKREMLEIVAVQVGILCIGFLAGAGPWILLYPVTLVTITPALQVCRQWVEHYNGDLEGIDPRYCYIRSNIIERFLFAPMNFNYHGVHHHLTQIPYSRLPAVWRELKRRGVFMLERESYLSLLAKLPWQNEMPDPATGAERRSS